MSIFMGYFLILFMFFALSIGLFVTLRSIKLI
nr:cytochrome b6-f complex subunit VI [Pulvinaster venetus]UNJ16880.1 cytochrome b6-f complex subunit VI [Pulvinaster venetus]